MGVHYSYYTWELFPAVLNETHVIKTHASNIKPEALLRPVHQTNYLGINGGFFASDDYNAPPTASRSIS